MWMHCLGLENKSLPDATIIPNRSLSLVRNSLMTDSGLWLQKKMDGLEKIYRWIFSKPSIEFFIGMPRRFKKGYRPLE